MPKHLTGPVDRQIDAYNRRDIEAFVSVYADDAVIFNPPRVPVLQGREAIRERYAELFRDSPELRATVHHRTVVGEWVVDHETVEGASIPGVGEAIVAYRVNDEKILEVVVLK